MARRLAPGDQRAQGRWNNRLQRWLHEGDDLVRPDDFDQLWPVIDVLSDVTGTTPDREWWAALHARSSPNGELAEHGNGIAVPSQRKADSGRFSMPAAAHTASSLPAADPTSMPEETRLGEPYPMRRAWSDLLRSSRAWTAFSAVALLGAAAMWTQLHEEPRAPEPELAWFEPPSAGRQPTVLLGPGQQVMEIAFDPRGAELVGVGGDGTVFTWTRGQTDSAASVALSSGVLFGLAFMPDARTYFTGGESGQITELDTKTNRVVAVFPDQPGETWSLAVSPQGDVLAEGTGDGHVRFWDPAARVVIREIDVTAKPVDFGIGGLAFSPDGKWLATGGPDAIVRIWDVASGEQVTSLEEHTERVNKVAFSDDGTRLASTADDARAIVWNTRDWRVDRVLAGHNGGVWGVDFSPDRRRLVTASMDDSARVWDLETGGTRVLNAPAGNVWDCVFDPTGKVVATSHEEDRSVRLWAVD